MSRAIETIDEFKAEVHRLQGILAENINDDYYPRNFHGDILRFDVLPHVTFDSSIGNANTIPIVELISGKFWYVISERGMESVRVAETPEKILERLFRDITSTLAGEFEVRNRIEGQDFRRAYFAKQIELLNLLNPAWAASEARRQREILKTSPFMDDISKSSSSPGLSR